MYKPVTPPPYVGLIPMASSSCDFFDRAFYYLKDLSITHDFCMTIIHTAALIQTKQKRIKKGAIQIIITET
jgi:hypothetical protein